MKAEFESGPFPKKFDLVWSDNPYHSINYILLNGKEVWRCYILSHENKWYKSEFEIELFKPYKIIGTDLTYEECLFLMNL